MGARFGASRWEAGNGLGELRSHINENKVDRIVDAVQHYMKTNELDCDFRFDMGEVKLGKGKPEIRIMKEVFSVN